MPGRRQRAASALLAAQPAKLAEQSQLFGELPNSPRHLRESERRFLARLPDAGAGMHRLAREDEKTGRTLARRGLVRLSRVRGLAGFTIEFYACRTPAGRDAVTAP